MDERWRVHVDRETCIGSGVCLGIAPGRFELREGLSTPVADTVDGDERVTDAAENCPVEAISVYARDSGSRISPEH